MSQPHDQTGSDQHAGSREGQPAAKQAQENAARADAADAEPAGDPRRREGEPAAEQAQDE